MKLALRHTLPDSASTLHKASSFAIETRLESPLPTFKHIVLEVPLIAAQFLTTICALQAFDA